MIHSGHQKRNGNSPSKRVYRIRLFVFDCIADEQQKQMELDLKFPVFSVPTDSELDARRKLLALLFHPDQGVLLFCQANRIFNVSDWIPALKKTPEKAFKALFTAAKLLLD